MVTKSNLKERLSTVELKRKVLVTAKILLYQLHDKSMEH